MIVNIDYSKAISYFVIFLLSIIILSTCTNSENAQLALKDKIKISDLKADIYKSKITQLNANIVQIGKQKQAERVKIVTVIKEVEKKINLVPKLNTKGIANYYQNRYKLPVTITQYGVALSDTIAKLNIKETIEKDGLQMELELTKNILLFSENQNIIKDTIILNKDLIIIQKDSQIGLHLQLEKSLNKSIKAEKTKKTIWKVASGILLAGGGYYLVTQ